MYDGFLGLDFSISLLNTFLEQKDPAAEALSRRPAIENDLEREDVDAFLDHQLTSVYHVSAGEDERSISYLDENEFWTEESLKIAKYLLTPKGCPVLNITDSKRKQ